MRILITGAAGYIGTELVYKLSVNPEVESITIYDNLSRGNHSLFIGKQKISQHIKFIHGEILDSRRLKQALKDIDVVYHLAAKVTTPFANLDGHIFEQVNHWGTAELVYAVEESDVKKFIYASSTSVYGNNTEPAFEETHAAPDSFYAISKYRAEQHVQRLFNKLNTLILRLGNVYGYSKSMRFDAVINRFMFDAHFTNRITINGSGEQYRSFIHIDKVTEILSQLFKNPLPNGIYNVTDKNINILTIAETLKELYPNLETFFINQNYAGHSQQVQSPSALLKYINIPQSNLKEELTRFKEQFTFIVK